MSTALREMTVQKPTVMFHVDASAAKASSGVEATTPATNHMVAARSTEGALLIASA